MRLRYGDSEVEVEVNVHTAVIYEQQFHSDMIKDLLGKQVVTEGKATGWDTDGETVTFDFASVNWLATMRAFWSAATEADPKFPPFEVFEREHEEMNLYDYSIKLANEVTRVFLSVPDQGQPEGEAAADPT